MRSEMEVGEVRLRGVSRTFRIVHERNATLKETLLRRRRTLATDRWALRAVDLDVRKGEALGIIGENGSGKSTLLKLVAGILKPQSGTVESRGVVASMLELGAGFHPDFTGRENVHLNGAILGLSEQEVESRFDQIVGFAELQDSIDMPVKTYSSGMQMRLAFSVASHVHPDILLLDEVLAVGDEAFQRKCFGRMFEYRRTGGTLLFVSHDPTMIERMCDRAILIEDGRIVEDGLPAIVLNSYHRRLAGKSPSSGSQTDSPSDYEDSPVVIRAVRTLGESGPARRFASGEALTIELEIDATSAVEGPIFGIAIHSVDGSLIYGTNTRLDSLSHILGHGLTSVRFTIPHLHLHEGSFVVTAAVHSFDEATIYDWRERCAEFTVFPQGSGVGLVNLSGEWSITPPREPEATITVTSSRGDGA